MNCPQGCNEDSAAPWNEIYQPREYLTVDVEVWYEDETQDTNANYQIVTFTVDVEDQKAEIAYEAKDWCRRKELVYIDWFLT